MYIFYNCTETQHATLLKHKTNLLVSKILIYLFVYLFVCGDGDRTLLCNPGWAGIYDVAQVNVKLLTIFLIQF